MRGFSDFEFVPTATMPMFLFSATFFPLSSYGSWAWLAQLSPLYHGVALGQSRPMPASSRWRASATSSCLLAIAAVAMSVAARRLGRLLLS